jgi:glucose-1-phosphate thymidylyltransferase
MKGIILAGGKGTRLNPLTSSISKQLLPVFDKPLIYYPLSSLISLGIKDILVISDPKNLNQFKELLKHGEQFGISINYHEQESPNGIAESFIIGESFIQDEPVALILGDNIFISDILSPSIIESFKSGAMIFTSKVKDPERYGVLETHNNKPVRIIEKPKEFISNHAVTGLYIYDSHVTEIAKKLKPSQRGELEITDVNQKYLEKGKLYNIDLGSSSAWMDAGTFDSLMDAGHYISSLQKRSKGLFGSPEISALQAGFISKDDLISSIGINIKNPYYLSIIEAID